MLTCKGNPLQRRSGGRDGLGLRLGPGFKADGPGLHLGPGFSTEHARQGMISIRTYFSYIQRYEITLTINNKKLSLSIQNHFTERKSFHVIDKSHPTG